MTTLKDFVPTEKIELHFTRFHYSATLWGFNNLNANNVGLWFMFLLSFHCSFSFQNTSVYNSRNAPINHILTILILLNLHPHHMHYYKPNKDNNRNNLKHDVPCKDCTQRDILLTFMLGFTYELLALFTYSWKQVDLPRP